MGAATVRAGGVVVFESPVQLSTTYGALPRGASLLPMTKKVSGPTPSGTLPAGQRDTYARCV